MRTAGYAIARRHSNTVRGRRCFPALPRYTETDRSNLEMVSKTESSPVKERRVVTPRPDLFVIKSETGPGKFAFLQQNRRLASSRS
jgi:hypothetical protein